MSEKKDRNPWDSRYDDGDDEEPEPEESAETPEKSETSKMSKSSETAESEETSTEAETSEGGTVRERKNVNMYLPEGLVGDLQLRYSELNVEWRREYDDDLPKNDQFYPAVIRAALEGTSVEEQLPLGEE